MIVAPLVAEFIGSVYEFRSVIDPLASGLAAKHLTAEAIDEEERILKAGHRALASRSVERLISVDMDFHLLIYEISGYKLLTEIVSTC